MPEERRLDALIGHQTCPDRKPAEVIPQLAARQHGVVARWQLLEAGLTPKMMRTRLGSGALLPLHTGVYAVGHRQLRREGHWLAAVLAVGPDAVLSHRDAAGLHALRAANHTKIDVTTTRRGRASQPRIVVHHTVALEAADVTTIDGIPTTTVARTLVDLAGVVSRESLAKAVNEAERQRTFDLTAIEAALARTRGRSGPGHARLRAVLAELRHRGTQLTRSVLEDRFLSLIETHNLPRPSANLHVEGREVDAVWPAERLAVELDGYANHQDRKTFQRDRDKGNALAEAGWLLLRFTHDDVVRRPAQTAEQVRRLLHLRAAGVA